MKITEDPVKITEDPETKLTRLIEAGQTFFEATAMYPNFSDTDAYQLFDRDVTALRNLAKKRNLRLEETTQSQTGSRSVKTVRII